MTTITSLLLTACNRKDLPKYYLSNPFISSSNQDLPNPIHENIAQQYKYQGSPQNPNPTYILHAITGKTCCYINQVSRSNLVTFALSKLIVHCFPKFNHSTKNLLLLWFLKCSIYQSHKQVNVEMQSSLKTMKKTLSQI